MNSPGNDVAEDGLGWLNAFPELLALDTSARNKLKQSARLVEAPIGTIGYRETDPCNAYVMRLAGRSRVYKISETGREILLYRVGAGETCVLTTTCLLGRSHYPASTVVEEPIRDVVVPAATFHQLMVESEVFRRFVLGNYGDLISDLIVLVDEVAFRNIASRLAGLLLRTEDGVVKATHQQLADELGSAREVVSRQLKDFERNGWILLQRGSVQVLDRAALHALA